MTTEANPVEQNSNNEQTGDKRRRTQRRRPRKSRDSNQSRAKSDQAISSSTQVTNDMAINEGAKEGWTLDQFVVEPVEGKERFHDFYLPDTLMRGIQELGFQYSTPIQAATIRPALQGKDIIGKAQTGTGKTAAFLIGLITDLLDFKLDVQPRKAEPRALIIAPTRELALQIAADSVGLCKYTGLNTVALVGGMDYDVQREALAKAPVDILVATPGRLIDFVRSQDIDLYNVEVLVLDEADRMLSMGFIPDVRTIIRNTPRKGAERQTLLYSATFTDEIMRLASSWTRDPVTVEIESDFQTTDNVTQTVFLVSSDEKYNLLRNYLRANQVERAIVFCNRRHQTRKLAERLEKDGVKAAMMSGEIPQNKRIKTLEGFRSGKIEVLVATDVAGRGIHIDGVSHVINYQLPEDADDYVHRIGRTGRAGASGESICFACEDDSFLIPDIEAQTGVKLDCVHPDSALLVDPNAAITNDDAENLVVNSDSAESLAISSDTVETDNASDDSDAAPQSDAESTQAWSESNDEVRADMDVESNANSDQQQDLAMSDLETQEPTNSEALSAAQIESDGVESLTEQQLNLDMTPADTDPTEGSQR